MTTSDLKEQAEHLLDKIARRCEAKVGEVSLVGREDMISVLPVRSEEGHVLSSLATVRVYHDSPGVVHVTLGIADNPHRRFKATPGVEARIAEKLVEHREHLRTVLRAQQDREATRVAVGARFRSVMARLPLQGAEVSLVLSSSASGSGYVGQVPVAPERCPDPDPECGETKIELGHGRLECFGCVAVLPSVVPAGRHVEVRWDVRADRYSLDGLGDLTLGQLERIIEVIR